MIANALVKQAQYVRNVNILGGIYSKISFKILFLNRINFFEIILAPYDWRKAPDELNEFYNNLTKLVENACN